MNRYITGGQIDESVFISNKHKIASSTADMKNGANVFIVSTKKIILFAGLFFILSLFYVWCHAQVVKMTYSLSKMNQTSKDLESENDRLKLEIATLTAPVTLFQRATSELKMVSPSEDQIVIVKENLKSK